MQTLTFIQGENFSGCDYSVCVPWVKRFSTVRGAHEQKSKDVIFPNSDITVHARLFMLIQCDKRCL